MDSGFFYTLLRGLALILLLIDLASCEMTGKTSEKPSLKPHGEVQLRKQAAARSTMLGYNSSQSFNDSATKLEVAIEYSDRKILEEYHSFAFGLKAILKHVEFAARRCRCLSMYEPILDSKKRLNHGLNAVSKKLYPGTMNTNP